jgi:nitric oxide reductase subunit B
VLRWLRAIGDTVFGIGISGVGWFVVGLTTGWSVYGRRSQVIESTGE